MFKLLKLAALGAAMTAIGGTVVAQDDKVIAKAVDVRQGYMKVVGFQMGTLGPMAKGRIPYDAQAATTAANNLHHAASIDTSATWVQGSDNGALGDKTRALPKIWADSDEFGQKWKDFRAAASALVDEAGKGQEALVAAMDPVGKSCGGCHKPFRAAKK